MVTSVTNGGGTQKLPQKFKICRNLTDKTIHWKALEEHFLMGHFWGIHLQNFPQKTSVLKELN
jgi:hypothetical protein